jgi:hypothetical protein
MNDLTVTPARPAADQAFAMAGLERPGPRDDTTEPNETAGDQG